MDVLVLKPCKLFVSLKSYGDYSIRTLYDCAYICLVVL